MSKTVRQYIDQRKVEIPVSVAKRFRSMLVNTKFSTIQYDLLSKIRETKTSEELDDVLIGHLDFQTFVENDVELPDDTEKEIVGELEPDTTPISGPVVERISLKD